jgi:hypothetical protein
MYTLLQFQNLVIGVTLIGISSCKSPSVVSHDTINQVDSLVLYPYWIEMMNDSTVNYYDAVNAFDIYWKNRVKPTEDNGEAIDIFGNQKSPEEEQKEKSRTSEHVFEYKQFLNWKQTHKNLIKPDGTLLTNEEIMNEWEKQKNERTQ